MKKYIITEKQLKSLISFQRLNEEEMLPQSKITHENGKIKINNQRYSVSVKLIGDIFIDNVVSTTGGYKIIAKKLLPFGVTSKPQEIFLASKRADEIIKQVPKKEIVSVGSGDGKTFTLKKV